MSGKLQTICGERCLMIKKSTKKLWAELDVHTQTIITNTVDYQKLIYLAVPYTHKYKSVREDRFQLVSEVSGLLANLKVANVSPITQSHVQSLFVKIGTTWETWKHIDTILLNSCDELWILCLPGWRDSIGVNAEYIIAKNLKLQIRFILYEEKKKTFEITEEIENT